MMETIFQRKLSTCGHQLGTQCVHSATFLRNPIYTRQNPIENKSTSSPLVPVPPLSNSSFNVIFNYLFLCFSVDRVTWYNKEDPNMYPKIR